MQFEPFITLSSIPVFYVNDIARNKINDVFCHIIPKRYSHPSRFIAYRDVRNFSNRAVALCKSADRSDLENDPTHFDRIEPWQKVSDRLFIPRGGYFSVWYLSLIHISEPTRQAE